MKRITNTSAVAVTIDDFTFPTGEAVEVSDAEAPQVADRLTRQVGRQFVQVIDAGADRPADEKPTKTEPALSSKSKGASKGE